MRFAIKDAANIWFINKKTKVPAFYTEDANTFEFKLSAETVYAKAKGNKAIAFDGEVTCDLKIEFEVIQFAQLSVMLASDVVEKTNHEGSCAKKYKLSSEKKVSLEKIDPVPGSVIAFKLKDDGQEFGEKLTLTTAKSGSNTDITITSSTAKEGDMVMVFYMLKRPKVNTVTMSDKGNSPNFQIEADVAGRNTLGEMMALHLSIKNAKAKRNAELTLSAENPSKFPMEFDCFPDELGDYAELTFLDDTGASVASLVEMLDPTAKLREDKDK